MYYCLETKFKEICANEEEVKDTIPKVSRVFLTASRCCDGARGNDGLGVAEMIVIQGNFRQTRVRLMETLFLLPQGARELKGDQNPLLVSSSSKAPVPFC